MVRGDHRERLVATTPPTDEIATERLDIARVLFDLGRDRPPTLDTQSTRACTSRSPEAYPRQPVPKRKPTPEPTRPDVTCDVRSVAAIEQAFARELPRLAPPDPTRPPSLTTTELHEQVKTFTRFVWACVDALLPSEPAPTPRAFMGWSAEQRALLTEMAKLPSNAMVNAGDLSERLLRLGAMSFAPGDSRYLERYVGRVAPSVLEQVVEGRPLWLWLRLTTMREVRPEAFASATSRLADAERIELARLAVTNCYQLMRRWPFPTAITRIQEEEDAASLFDALLPMLSPLEDSSLARALAVEASSEVGESALILLFVYMLVRRGQRLDESVDAALAEALDLFPVHGRKLLAAFTPEKRSAILSRMEPVPYNVSGFWTYVDLLTPAEQAERVAIALTGFASACSSDVSRRVKDIVATFDSGACAALRELAQGKGPNAALAAEALALRR